MSYNSVSFNNGQQLQVNTNLAKLFPFGMNGVRNYVYTNSTYVSGVTWLAGTVMGVISGTGKVTPLTSVATDGSQFVVGILAMDIIVDSGETLNVPILTEGWVREDMILLQGSDTLQTVISGRRIYEKIGGESVGIFIQGVKNATDFTNQLT